LALAWAVVNDPLVTLARGEGVMGEVALRRRSGSAQQPIFELIVNGVFLMDTAETSTERLLSDVILDRHSAPRRVLVGGLGLGLTVNALLSDARVEQVVVAEIEPLLVDWLRCGLVPTAQLAMADPRVEVVVADIADVLRRADDQSYDAVLLDVDNGPGFLTHPDNAALYEQPALADAARILTQEGMLAVWSADPAPDLAAALEDVVGPVEEIVRTVSREGREVSYFIYLATRTNELASLFAPTEQKGGMMCAMTEFRIERDTMGEVQVPKAAKYRAQTQRAVENFPISGTPLEPAQIAALARIKAAAAAVNAELGIIDDDVAEAISAAADEVASGRWDGEFPIDVFQTGSGTSSNMNMNEVLATLASERLGRPIHPNDHVNASQSSNDVFPSSIHVAATDAVVNDLVPALRYLEASLRRKAEEFATVVKSGRTHLMDATPVTLGQEFGGYATQVAYGVERLQSSLPRLAELPLGGTAVGTGINTPPGFSAKVIERLAETMGLPLTEARDHFEAQGARDGLVETSGQLRTIAVGLYKIVNDVRWMGSGPRAGLAEIRLPDLQPGSSIMPGKVNPVVPEAVAMVCAQVVGNDTAVAWGGGAGSFELNVMLPMLARNLLESIRLLANASRLLADRCVDGIEADVERNREYAESSPSIVTPLNRYIGYENAAAVAKKALAERKTIREVVIEEGYVERGDLTEAQLDQALDVLGMTHP
jgi:fumarate hydratase class II